MGSSAQQRSRRAERAPSDPALPFFAYGIFMPREIAFFQIKPFVDQVHPASVPGRLLIRDGVPVLNRTITTDSTEGFRIEFKPGTAAAAFDAIQEMEPKTQYKWAQIDGMNVLAAYKPGKGTRPLDPEKSWSSWEDPAFVDALGVVEEALADDFRWHDFKPFFRLQGAYMILWSSIERYVSLRYGLGRNDQVLKRVKRLAAEVEFGPALRATDPSGASKLRTVSRSDDPDDTESFDVDGPAEKAIDYFYQVRSNVTHRGKEEPLDWELLHASTSEVLRIFRRLLAGARAEATWDMG